MYKSSRKRKEQKKSGKEETKKERKKWTINEISLKKKEVKSSIE